jgi:hypothetical protein
MLFRVPLPYKVKGTPKGKRNETDEQFWEYVEVDIPVLTDETAPIAVSWDDSCPSDKMYFKYEDDWRRNQAIPEDGQQVMRMKEGEFYLRHGLTPDELALKLTPESDFRLFGEAFIYHNQRAAERPFDESQYRQDKPIESTFDNDVAKLRSAVEVFIIVGDRIYRKSSEPVIVKWSYRTDEGSAIAPRIIPSGKLDAKTPSFRLDKYPQIVAELDEFALRYNNGAHRPSMARAPKVYLAQAIGYNDLSNNFVNAVRTYLEGYSDHPRLKAADPDTGIAFLQMKKALRIFDSSGDIDGLEAAAGNYVENFPEEVRYGHLAGCYREYADRPVGTLSVGAWRKQL